MKRIPDRGGKRGGQLSDAERAQVIEDAELLIRQLERLLEAWKAERRGQAEEGK